MLSNLPNNVTQSEIDRYGSISTESMTLAEFHRINENDTPYESDSPGCVQSAFNEYVTDQFIERGLHPDDDRPDMWIEFCEMVNDGRITIKEKVAA